jgi:hypothetical protein
VIPRDPGGSFISYSAEYQGDNNPMLTIPVSSSERSSFFLSWRFSLNTLSMLGLVLAIGIVGLATLRLLWCYFDSGLSL